jgi:hypothetical protein
VGRKIGGAALLLLSALMLLGFARSGASMGSPTTLFALLITVALPAAGGIALLRGALGGNSKARMQQLRQQTIDAEILRLAMARQGKLTAVEVASALALPEGEARSSLDSLVAREVADLDVTDEGILVYSFHDARYYDGDPSGKGLLGG